MRQQLNCKNPSRETVPDRHPLFYSLPINLPQKGEINVDTADTPDRPTNNVTLCVPTPPTMNKKNSLIDKNKIRTNDQSPAATSSPKLKPESLPASVTHRLDLINFIDWRINEKQLPLNVSGTGG